MSVTQTDTIDIISTSAEQEVVLFITDHLPWEEAGHLSLLEDKLSSYLRFIKSDQILEDYPAAKNCPLVIQVTMQYEPPHEVVAVLTQAKKFIAGEGIEFRWQVFGQ
jgi:hypothetical protein